MSSGLQAQKEEVLFRWHSSPTRTGRVSMYLARHVDTMTDQTQCVLFLRPIPSLHSLYFALSGDSEFEVLTDQDDISFRNSEQHFARVAGQTAIRLLPQDSKVLKAAQSDETRRFIKSMASGQSVHLRYHIYRQSMPQVTEYQFPFLAYGYAQGVSKCGWKDLELGRTLPQPELERAEGSTADRDGAQLLRVKQNQRLRLLARENGESCDLNLLPSGLPMTDGGLNVFGRHQGKLVRRPSRTYDELLVRDVEGTVLFSAELPRYDARTPVPWPNAIKAVRAMRQAAPFGSIVLANVAATRDPVSLYGFRELWRWGVENCAFPSVE